MDAPVLDEIRRRCREVALHARSVGIDAGAVEVLAGALTTDPGRRVPDPAHHGFDDPELTALFVLVLDAVNFGSGWFPFLRRTVDGNPYFTIAAAVRAWIGDGAVGATDLTAITPADCHALFSQPDDGGPAHELMGLFATAIAELGAALVAGHGGSAAAFVAAAGQRADRLVRALTALPTFRDVTTYDGEEVPLLKRAQLAALDLSRAFGGEGLGRFDDLDRLTVFADNLLPHVLRVDGVLRYSDALADRIERGELLVAGEPDEVEIRACAVHACELIVAELQRLGHGWTAAELDQVLWQRGLEERYAAVPVHLCRTTAY